MILAKQHQARNLAGAFSGVDQHLSADNWFYARLFGRAIKLDEPEQVLLVRDGDGRHAQLPGFVDQLPDAHRAIHQ